MNKIKERINSLLDSWSKRINLLGCFTQQMAIEEVDLNSSFSVYGVTFKGVQDLIEVERSRKPRNGVYVYANRISYPCFDSSDYAYEDRSYWNFIFGRTPQELNERKRALCSVNAYGANRKISLELAEKAGPMVYWGGDTDMPLEMTVGKDLKTL